MRKFGTAPKVTEKCVRKGKKKVNAVTLLVAVALRMSQGKRVEHNYKERGGDENADER